MDNQQSRNLRRFKWYGIGFLLAFMGAATAVTVPNIFSAGTTISSSQVNANFTALVTAVTSLEQKGVGFDSFQNASPGATGTFVTVGVNDVAMKSLGTVAVSAPSAGFIIATLAGSVTYFGDGKTIKLGIGDSAATMATSVDTGRLDGFGALRYTAPYSVTALIPVAAAGVVTIHGLAQGNATFGASTANVGISNLTAVFIPTRL